MGGLNRFLFSTRWLLHCPRKGGESNISIDMVKIAAQIANSGAGGLQIYSTPGVHTVWPRKKHYPAMGVTINV